MNEETWGASQGFMLKVHSKKVGDTMSKRDLLLALLLVIVWGANFTVIKLGLSGVPSLVLAASRFFIVSVTAIFFVKRPKLHWKYIVAYGLTLGVGQFGLLFYAIEIGMPAGIASIVLQTQPFFTVLLAAVLLGEAVKRQQVVGLFIMAAGLILISGAYKAGGLSAVPMVPFLLTISAALFWSISNIVIRFATRDAQKHGEKLDMLGLVVWSSLVPPIPLMILALLVDSPQDVLHALTNLKWISVFSAFYLAFLATLFGYGVWTMLFDKYPTGKVAPLSLLVPVTGLFTAQVVLGEKLTSVQWLGCLVIIAGLLVSNFGIPRLKTVK